MGISVPISTRMMINSKLFCFAKFLDQSSFERVTNPDSLCGNRDPLLQRTVPGRRKIMFTTFHDVTIPILQELLPAAGMTLATGVYTANQLVATIPIIIDKAGNVHEYTDCRMTRFILRGQTGTLPVSAECTWIAEDELEDAATTWVDGTVDFHFGFPGTTFKIATVAAEIDRFAFVIDSKLVQSWNASFTVTDVGMGPRQTLLATTIPYTTGANENYYWTYRDITTGAAIELKITSGGDSLTINIPKGVLNPESPSIEGALEEIRLPMTWEAKRQASVAAFNMVLVDA